LLNANFSAKAVFPRRCLQWLLYTKFRTASFSSIILYDTSRLVRDEEDNYVMAAVSMYLNLFLSFLLLGISIDD
jgi:FtsH-binding integral membrane protein